MAATTTTVEGILHAMQLHNCWPVVNWGCRAISRMQIRATRASPKGPATVVGGSSRIVARERKRKRKVCWVVLVWSCLLAALPLTNQVLAKLSERCLRWSPSSDKATPPLVSVLEAPELPIG